MSWFARLLEAIRDLFRAPVRDDTGSKVDPPDPAPNAPLSVPEDEYIESMAVDPYWEKFYEEPDKYFRASAVVYDMLREGIFPEEAAFRCSQEFGREAADHLLEVTVYSMCTEYTREVEVYLRKRHM